MNDKYVNSTGVQTIKTWIEGKFALDSDLDALDTKVDGIIAEGGEPNVIETVKVNGTALTPVNKAVDVEVPTATSDLTNDGDGTSNFATEEYVDQNGGKIQKIKVNNVEQTIDTTDKSVNIEVPKFFDMDVTETYTYSQIKEKIDAGYSVRLLSLPSTAGGFVSVGSTRLDGTGDNATLCLGTVFSVNNRIHVSEMRYHFDTNTWTDHSLAIPTNVSELTNDSGFITNTVNNLTNYYTKSETYTQAEVENLVNTAMSGAFVPVATLPTASASTMNKIYLVPKSTSKTNNTKNEYITIENSGSYDWELIGDTQIDLSNYWNSTNLQALTVAEINAILEPSA